MSRRAGRRGGAGEQSDAPPAPADQPLDGGEVLLGERLGRRHQRRLVAMLDGAQHRMSATTVLPLPTSPISSRCIGCGWRRSSPIVAIAVRWSP